MNNWTFDSQLQTLLALESYMDTYGRSPTLNELAKMRGLATITIRKHIDALVERGKVKRVAGKRNLRLMSAA